MTNVGGEAFELESLEDGPTDEVCVGRGEFAEIFGEILIGEVGRRSDGNGMLFGSSELIRSVPTKELVLGPIRFLAFSGAVLGDHATTTKTEATGLCSLGLSTSITKTMASRLGRRVRGDRRAGLGVTGLVLLLVRVEGLGDSHRRLRIVSHY